MAANTRLDEELREALEKSAAVRAAAQAFVARTEGGMVSPDDIKQFDDILKQRSEANAAEEKALKEFRKRLDQKQFV
jgi:ferric-dicitrate binding protein FerR (iron transport regulator)